MKNKDLNVFLKDVANTIRDVEGSTDLINPQDFSDRIIGLSSGSGSSELEGEYFLVKPNGRYKRMKTGGYVNPEYLSEEQKMAIAASLMIQSYGFCYSGFMCNAGAGSGTYKHNFIGDPVSLAGKIGIGFDMWRDLMNSGDMKDSYELNDHTCFAWEERDVSVYGTTYSFIEFAQILLVDVFGYEPSAEEVYEFLQVEDVDKADYDKWKNR